MRLCVFDLDHTLVRSPLDLTAMALDMRALLETRCGPLSPREDRYRVGELIAHCQRHAPAVEQELWALALDHERRALGGASLEPGARDAVAGARAAGFVTALWTNNAREITLEALGRFGLDVMLDLIVTRDEMRALKPDPDGWRVIAEHFGLEHERSPRESGERSHAPLQSGERSHTHPRQPTHTPIQSPTSFSVIIGDSWVDGVAAAAAGVPFVAYRTKSTDLERWKIAPIAQITDLATLPRWLQQRSGD